MVRTPRASNGRAAFLGTLVLLAVAAVFAASAGSAAAQAETSPGDASSGSVVSSVAPEWPFHGVVSEVGVFWSIAERSISRVSLGQLHHCRIGEEPEVEYDEHFVYFSNTVSYSQNHEVSGTYVVPWGDMAYPLMTNPAMTRKAIGQLPGQSVWDWRAERRGSFAPPPESLSYGSAATISLAADPDFAQSHLLYTADDHVRHYVLDHIPQDASLPFGAMSLSNVGPADVDALEAQADEYRIRQEEQEEQIRRLIESDNYDPHAGPAAVSDPWISALDDVYVRWDDLRWGFGWCDRRHGFVLDAASGEFVGCYEGELLEVWQNPSASSGVWAAPLGFSADECADSLELWQDDPVEWFLRVADRSDASVGQQ